MKISEKQVEKFFDIRLLRLHLYKENHLLIYLTVHSVVQDASGIRIVYEGSEVPFEYRILSMEELRAQRVPYNKNHTNFVLELELIEIGKKPLQIYGSKVHPEYYLNIDASFLKKIWKKNPIHIDSARTQDGNLILTGWLAENGEEEISVYCDGGEVAAEVSRSPRPDVAAVYTELPKGYEPGVEITIEDGGHSDLSIRVKGRQGDFRYDAKFSDLRRGEMEGRNESLLFRGLRYFRRNGLKETMGRVYDFFHYKDDEEAKRRLKYQEYLEKYGYGPEVYERQRMEKFLLAPLFSIVVPLFNTKPEYLKAMIQSVCEQTYSNWELCLADGSQTDALQGQVVAFAEKQGVSSKVKYIFLGENKGIAGNTNAAISMASGDYIVLGDHDDLFDPAALYECVKALNDDPLIDVIYTDEDKLDEKTGQLFDPHFKSDMNIDLLCSVNYICHMFVFSREIKEKVGGFESIYDGAQDHDFILRCVEAAKRVYHIPRILYHWRFYLGSTSMNPESKRYAFENGCKAVEAHYKRLGIPAKVEMGQKFGLYRANYEWPGQEPLLSILIPNKDHIDDLEKCIESLLNNNLYQNFEIILIENNSTQQSTFVYYDTLQKDQRLKGKLQIVYYEGGFNYSAINNYGATFARGEYYLLLNNDTEILSKDALKRMMDVARRADVGIVGAKLLYPDDTMQHGGVIIGLGGVAGHAFHDKPCHDQGYFFRNLCAQDLSAVTAACLLVKKEAFDKVGGLEEEYAVAFNDIDFCLKVRKEGYLVVYEPEAVLYHYESKSRGQEDTEEKVKRFNKEIQLFQMRWTEILENGDPYYNPNLSLDGEDYTLIS